MRKITSIILVLAFFAVCITGVQLEILDERPETNQPRTVQVEIKEAEHVADPSAQSGSLEHFTHRLHVVSGFIMLITGLVHVSYNFWPMMRYIGIRKN